MKFIASEIKGNNFFYYVQLTSSSEIITWTGLEDPDGGRVGMQYFFDVIPKLPANIYLTGILDVKDKSLDTIRSIYERSKIAVTIGTMQQVSTAIAYGIHRPRKTSDRNLSGPLFQFFTEVTQLTHPWIIGFANSVMGSLAYQMIRYPPSNMLFDMRCNSYFTESPCSIVRYSNEAIAAHPPIAPDPNFPDWIIPQLVNLTVITATQDVIDSIKEESDLTDADMTLIPVERGANNPILRSIDSAFSEYALKSNPLLILISKIGIQDPIFVFYQMKTLPKGKEMEGKELKIATGFEPLIPEWEWSKMVTREKTVLTVQKYVFYPPHPLAIQYEIYQGNKRTPANYLGTIMGYVWDLKTHIEQDSGVDSETLHKFEQGIPNLLVSDYKDNRYVNFHDPRHIDRSVVFI